VESIVPLENILHAGGFLTKLLLAAVLWLELWEILLDQIELNHLLVVVILALASLLRHLLLVVDLNRCGPGEVVQVL